MLCTACQSRYPISDGIPLMMAGIEDPDQTIGEDYDAIAPAYDASLPPHVTEHYLDKRVKFICQHVSGGAILDVGCGTGMLAKRLLQRGYPVVGADTSLGMLRLFQSSTASVPVGARANALPFPSEVFQGVVSIALLHHIADPELVKAALAEMYRVASKGGTLVLWDHNPLNPYWPLLMKRVPQDFGRERLIPLRELIQGLLEAGAGPVQAFRMGFVPDFVPPGLLPLMQWAEKAVERLPLIRRVAAHNVVVAHKG